MLHQYEVDYPDLGVPIDPEWWKLPRQSFSDQVMFHCHQCGIPLRGYGELAQSPQGVEQTSKLYEKVYIPKSSSRAVQVVTSRSQLQEQGVAKMTDYLGNSKRERIN